MRIVNWSLEMSLFFLVQCRIGLVAHIQNEQLNLLKPLINRSGNEYIIIVNI
jgi:hypothetical protein